MADFSQGERLGLMQAHWMIEAETERNIMAMDVERFRDWISLRKTLIKVIENYQKRFFHSYANEGLPAAHLLRTTAMYDIFDAMAQFEEHILD